MNPYFRISVKAIISTYSPAVRRRKSGWLEWSFLSPDIKKVDKKRVRALYENWLMDRGETLFLIKEKHYAKKVKVSPKRIIIKKLRKRWGSAPKEGILNLNAKTF